MSGETLNRRDALRAMAGFLGGAVAAACGSPPAGDAADAGGADSSTGGADAAAPADAGGSVDAGRIDATEDNACADSNLTPAQLLGEIDTFVVLCMENRSFDHYFGSLSLSEGRSDVDGLVGGESNPDPDGNPVLVHRLDDYTPADPPHGWGDSHDQWNAGANDGFVVAHAGSSQTDVMGYHERDQLPTLYSLADQGALCDRWYCSLLGPTWPNRYYLHGATSEGIKSNLPRGGFTSIFDQLDDAGVSHANYYHDIAWASGAYFKLDGNKPMSSFFDDAASGNLPQFTLIDPQFFGGGANDDHPSHDIRMGQALISSVVAALADGPQWNRCMFVVTYDEHGGFYDHVAPPTTVDERDEFQQLGFRVPSVVIGPHVKRGCAVHTPFEHVSVISTLAARYGLPPLNDRVAATADLSSCIDASTLGAPRAAPVVPPVELSRTAWRRRRPVATHQELAAALAARPLPPELDRRGDGNNITEQFLRRAADLGAVRFTD